MPKELVTTTNETTLITAPNTPAEDRITEIINTENEILLGIYRRRTFCQATFKVFYM